MRQVLILIFITQTTILYTQSFEGTLIYYVENSFSLEKYKNYLFQNGNDTKIKIDDYKNTLNYYTGYFICGDTLINFDINYLGDTIFKAVQLRDSLFLLPKINNKFTHMKIKTSLNNVKNLRLANENKIINNTKLMMFEGETQGKKTQFKIYINENEKFISQANWEYLFSDIFNLKGSIYEYQRTYLPSNYIKTVRFTEKKANNCTCYNTLNRLEFISRNSISIVLDSLNGFQQVGDTVPFLLKIENTILGKKF